MTAPPAIQVLDLTIRFGQVTAVESASFTVAPRQCFGIVGESGSGKTTILRAILGLQPFNAGRISLNGTDQPAGSRDFRAQTKLIQPIFQDPATSLSPRRRIGQLLSEVGEVLREPAEAFRLRAIAMLDRLGLPKEAMEKYPYQLSGGQARRAAIARALLFNPKIIAADEPPAGLDVSVQGDFLNLLQEIRAASDITLLVISHNLAVMRLVANDVAVMHKGRIVEQGAARQVLETPQSDYARALLGAWPRLRAGH
jgi:peptide/nickel transport system ATP-binding protein